MRPSKHQLAASAARTLVLVLSAMGALLLDTSTTIGQSGAPGGFVESATDTDIRPPVTPALPSRGMFTFPAPYNTTGVRLTNESDCAGWADCVQYVGYSYWRNIGNHTGRRTMQIFVTLNRNRGGAGPTLFTYDKLTDDVTVDGPLFDPSHPLSWDTGEGWYFSALQATKLYVTYGSGLYRYDVLDRTFEPVFDVSNRFGPNRVVKSAHSSMSDRMHSGVLVDTTTWAPLACVVYDQASGVLSSLGLSEHARSKAYPPNGLYDECQIDTSGRWLLIKDNVDGRYGEDNVMDDLRTGRQDTFLDEAGAAGHSDNGFGYMVANDNWHALPGAVRLWEFGEPFPSSEPGSPPQGLLVYHTTSWAGDIGHISHTNAQPGIPPRQQYVCGGNARREIAPRNNEIVCFPLDGSLRALVVAPVMSNLDAPGGGTDDYAKLPKGNLDVNGEYFIWTSNVGGNRLDAFLVKVRDWARHRADGRVMLSGWAANAARLGDSRHIMPLPIVHVDAFTSAPFAGNPAAVCVLTETRDDTWMQHVAREMNLAETAFLRARPDGFDLRWFTPTVEVDLCGHATLASAHALWESGQAASTEPLRFHTRSGLLTAVRQGDWIEMNFPATPEETVDAPADLLKSIGVVPQYVGKSRFDYLVELESEEAVRTLRPDLGVLRGIGARGMIVTSRSARPDDDFVSRFFAPAFGIDEDPVTGSAHCCLAPFWSPRLNKTAFKARQISPRGGVLKVQLDGDRVRISGQAVTVLRGELLA